MKTNNLLITLLIFSFLGCKQEPSTIIDSYMYVQNEGREKKDWKIVWEDHFDGTEMDTAKWTRIPPNNADWGRHMTTNDVCYELKDGKLYLKGINNPDTVSDPRPFLTGGVYTKHKFAFQYGKIEIHAKLESAQGAWPAIWLLGEKNKYGGWPHSGEIDIMEHLNYDDIIYQTTHSNYTINLKQKHNPPHGGTAKIDAGKFNTFGLVWYPDSLVFTLNGEKTFAYPRVEDVDKSQWPYDQPFYILIDQQLGGSWVGGVNPEDLPVNMIVDYVKVYQ